MNKKIILASGSPRRKELLTQIGLEFEVIKSECDEITSAVLPNEYVMELSRRKAYDVYERLTPKQRAEHVVVGADTVVAFEDQILGKPGNRERAISMLQDLSGKTHAVYTGVTLITEKSGKACDRTFFEKTEVTMFPMSQQEIEAYADTGEPLDKAGAYAIQGKCAAYIQSIDGPYENVVGLPIGRLYQELKIL